MLSTNFDRVRQAVKEAALAAGRSIDSIKLVAVSKRMSLERIQQAVDCGHMLFGENRIQEATQKIPLLAPELHWHFIGTLQSNKAKLAVELFDVIETVDRLKIAQALDKHAKNTNKVLSILIQVNVGGEQQKSGVSPQDTEKLIRSIAQTTDLRIIGLMTMPPYHPDPELSRPYFRELKELAAVLANKNLFFDNTHIELSMGMSGDYLVAIEEGATLIRVGTALFGPRG